jgi:tetratricopeptide (TPR) repeat protein
MGRKKLRQPKTPVPTTLATAKRYFPSWLNHPLAAVALCGITLMAYCNSFHGGFVIDNRLLILGDPRIRQATWANIELILHRPYWWPTTDLGLYRPITTLSYLFNYALLGNADDPSGYHWTNFLLHLLNVILVYALALRLLRRFWPAIFISALWSVHPVLTESVKNIVGRSDLLAAAAVLSGFLMYLKSTESHGFLRYAWLVGLMAVTTIGVFSKESAVVILGVIALYEITFWRGRKQLRAVLLGSAAVAVPLLVMLYVRTKVLAAALPTESPFLANPLWGVNFFRARMTAIAVIAKYFWLLVWPARLSTDYSYSQIPIATGTLHDWIAWITVAIVLGTAAVQFTKRHLFFFFGGFALMTFVPVSNLLILIGTIMAERFLYLPAIGFAACFVMAVYAISDRFRMRALAPIVLCVFIASLAIRTVARNTDWQDELAMATASVRVSPNSYKTHFNLAVQLTKSDPARSNLSHEMDEVKKSMDILNSLPDFQNSTIVYAEAGRQYTEKGDQLVRIGADGKQIIPSESLEAYNRSLQILLRGVAIDKESEAVYRVQLRATGKYATVPIGSVPLYVNLSNTYMRLEQYPNAREAAVHARLLDPSVRDNYLNIGQVFAIEGHKDEAALAFMEGLLATSDSRFLGTLGVLYKYGLDPDGCAIQRTASGVLLNPQCAPVHNEVCAASAELISLYDQNLRDDLAEPIKAKARDQFGCPAAKSE